MENLKDIRWKQRFENYTKAVLLLEQSLALETPDIFQKAGTIQLFEMAFELAWKTLKDYLEAQGFDAKSPRNVLQTSFQNEIIEDGHLWIEALNTRNLLAHVYDEKETVLALQNIKTQYAKLLLNLNKKLKTLE